MAGSKKKSPAEDENGPDKEVESNAEETTPKRPRKKDGTPKKRNYRPSKKDEIFDYQPTGTASLPPAKDFVEVFIPKVLETLHGLRDARSLGRMVNYKVYQAIEARAASVKVRNQVSKDPAPRPVFALGNVLTSEPRDGVCEASAVVHGPTRTRAVAVRIEGLDNTWKATSFRML